MLEFLFRDTRCLIRESGCKEKIAWNHTDYSILNPDRKRDQDIYTRIDYIVSVSSPCTEQFVKMYPEFRDKAVTIEIYSVRIFLKSKRKS